MFFLFPSFILSRSIVLLRPRARRSPMMRCQRLSDAIYTSFATWTFPSGAHFSLKRAFIHFTGTVHTDIATIGKGYPRLMAMILVRTPAYLEECTILPTA